MGLKSGKPSAGKKEAPRSLEQGRWSWEFSMLGYRRAWRRERPVGRVRLVVQGASPFS